MTKSMKGGEEQMNTMDYKPKINDKPLELYYGLEVCFRSGRVSHRDALMLCELEESMLSIKAYSPRYKNLSHLTDTPYDFIVTVGDIQFAVRETATAYQTDRIIHIRIHNN